MRAYVSAIIDNLCFILYPVKNCHAFLSFFPKQFPIKILEHQVSPCSQFHQIFDRKLTVGTVGIL